jgi:DNA-binding PadR family transcriptional regulator
LEEARPRRYYIISAEGKKLLPKLKKEWASIISVMDKILTK